MRMPSRLLALSLCALVFGCESSRRAAEEDAPAYARELDYGPREADRRPAGLEIESLFSSPWTTRPRTSGGWARAPRAPTTGSSGSTTTSMCASTRRPTPSRARSGSPTPTTARTRSTSSGSSSSRTCSTPRRSGARSHTPRGILRGRPTFEGGYTIPWIRSNGRELEFTVYDTLARIELPEPIEPGAVWTYELEWSFRMPPYLRRMGAEEVEQGKIFELAQWFPHACNYDDVHGWNTLPYLGTGEFYTNFGDLHRRHHRAGVLPS
jgi:hypothetical protein